MPETKVTDLSAELGTIREMAAQITDDHTEADCAADLGVRCTGHDAERMADALDAVLERHRPGRYVVLGGTCLVHENHRHFSITAIEAASVDNCQDCEATTYLSCAVCGDHVPLVRCPDRAAITEALTAKENPDGT
jgi:hypothetical protein